MKIFPTILLISVTLIILWFPYYLFMLGPGPAQEQVDDFTATSTLAFSIAKGTGLSQVAQSLEDEGLIKSSSIFKLYNLFTGNAHLLKPGLYEINLSSSTPEIVSMFVAGPPNHARVVIQEGLTVNQIDERLSQLGIIKSGQLSSFPVSDLEADYDFLIGQRSFEGYLFPDTYDFSLSADPEEIIRKFLDAFEEKALPLLSVGQVSISKMLTIASMIEKEVPDSQERKIVSGIIQNRLREGMRLQIDVTSIYAKIHGPAYDTYKISGLPPGPIANPGLDSIEAAMFPEKTDYFFYISHPETKETIFSKTLLEHQEKIDQFLKR